MAILPSLGADAREITVFRAVSFQSLRLRHIPRVSPARRARQAACFTARANATRTLAEHTEQSDRAASRSRDSTGPPSQCSHAAEPAAARRRASAKGAPTALQRPTQSGAGAPFDARARKMQYEASARSSALARDIYVRKPVSSVYACFYTVGACRRFTGHFLHIIDRLPDKICFRHPKALISMHDCRIKSFIYSFFSKILFQNKAPYAIMPPTYF